MFFRQASCILLDDAPVIADVETKLTGVRELVANARAGDKSGAKCSLTTDAGDMAVVFAST